MMSWAQIYTLVPAYYREKPGLYKIEWSKFFEFDRVYVGSILGFSKYFLIRGYILRNRLRYYLNQENQFEADICGFKVTPTKDRYSAYLLLLAIKRKTLPLPKEFGKMLTQFLIIL
jgi:hypothetical protein